MVARIVQAHGGSIEVAEGRGAGPGGAGACFRVSLPLRGPAERPDSEPRSAPRERAAVRIALLDDEARLVEILAMVLRREGYEVHGFTDPMAALAALESRDFDLLVTDLKMPGADGLEVLRRARKASRRSCR